MLPCLFLYANESCDFQVIFDHAQSSVRESVTQQKRYLFIYLFIFSSVSILRWRQSYYVNKQTFILDFGLKNYQVLRNQVYFNIPIFLL